MSSKVGPARSATRPSVRTIEAFEPYDYIVAPSGSCGGMLKTHYPELLVDDRAWEDRAKAFAGKVHELMSFLVDVRGMTAVDAAVQSKLLGAEWIVRP